MINFAVDSRERGYLAPINIGLDDNSLEDFFHDLLAGLSQIDGSYIRPRWQIEPPQLPEIGKNWISFGITEQKDDNIASEIFHGDEIGMSVIRGQELTILISCYGPEAENTISLIREGISLEQNREILRLNNIGFVITTPVINASMEINKRWSKRKDFSITFRRMVERFYPVREIISIPVDLSTETFTINTITN